MIDHAIPVLYALFLWWFSTGIVLYLDGLPRHTFRWSMAGASLLAAAAVVGLVVSKDDTTTTGAFVAFTSGLLIWGWHEMAFLMGYITGPSREVCPPGSRGADRFFRALRAVLWHELAIALTAALILLLTFGGENQIGNWTYLLLWILRISAKLNVFLGVPNLAEHVLPEHLGYLRSYLRRKPMNLLFPITVTAANIALVVLVYEAATAAPGSFEAVGFSLLAALLALAVLEHWFLVLPLADTALWAWALRSRNAPDRDLPPSLLPRTTQAG